MTPRNAPVLVLGCSRLGSALTPMGRRECLALIDAAYAAGVRQFDTASIYGQGDSERYLGEALKDRRDQVLLASKAGQTLSARQAALAHFKPVVRWLSKHRQGVRERVGVQRARGVPRCFEPDFIERSLIDSLRRLRTDRLDVFYLHSPAPEVLDDERLMERIEQLRSRGLFRSFGISCDEPELAWKAARHEAVQLVQFDVNAPFDAEGLLRELSTRKKQAHLRGFTRAGQTQTGGMSERFAQALQWPAAAGLIVGTVNVHHLKQNLRAFERALHMACRETAA